MVEMPVKMLDEPPLMERPVVPCIDEPLDDPLNDPPDMELPEKLPPLNEPELPLKEPPENEPPELPENDDPPDPPENDEPPPPVDEPPLPPPGRLEPCALAKPAEISRHRPAVACSAISLPIRFQIIRMAHFFRITGVRRTLICLRELSFTSLPSARVYSNLINYSKRTTQSSSMPAILDYLVGLDRQCVPTVLS